VSRFRKEGGGVGWGWAWGPQATWLIDPSKKKDKEGRQGQNVRISGNETREKTTTKEGRKKGRKYIFKKLKAR